MTFQWKMTQHIGPYKWIALFIFNSPLERLCPLPFKLSQFSFTSTGFHRSSFWFSAFHQSRCVSQSIFQDQCVLLLAWSRVTVKNPQRLESHFTPSSKTKTKILTTFLETKTKIFTPSSKTKTKIPQVTPPPPLTPSPSSWSRPNPNQVCKYANIKNKKRQIYEYRGATLTKVKLRFTKETAHRKMK